MTEDPLKALLMADTAAAVPVRDLSFVADVMKRAARRRLIEGLVWTGLSFVCVTAVLFVVMPYLSPVLTGMGQSLGMVAVVMALVGVGFIAWEQSRRYFRAYGFGL